MWFSVKMNIVEAATNQGIKFWKERDARADF